MSVRVDGGCSAYALLGGRLAPKWPSSGFARSVLASTLILHDIFCNVLLRQC